MVPSHLFASADGPASYLHWISIWFLVEFEAQKYAISFAKYHSQFYYNDLKCWLLFHFVVATSRIVHLFGNRLLAHFLLPNVWKWIPFIHHFHALQSWAWHFKETSETGDSKEVPCQGTEANAISARTAEYILFLSDERSVYSHRNFNFKWEPRSGSEDVEGNAQVPSFTFWGTVWLRAK